MEKKLSVQVIIIMPMIVECPVLNWGYSAAIKQYKNIQSQIIFALSCIVRIVHFNTTASCCIHTHIYIHVYLYILIVYIVYYLLRMKTYTERECYDNNIFEKISLHGDSNSYRHIDNIEAFIVLTTEPQRQKKELELL